MPLHIVSLHPPALQHLLEPLPDDARLLSIPRLGKLRKPYILRAPPQLREKALHTALENPTVRQHLHKREHHAVRRMRFLHALPGQIFDLPVGHKVMISP